MLSIHLSFVHSLHSQGSSALLTTSQNSNKDNICLKKCRRKRRRSQNSKNAQIKCYYLKLMLSSDLVFLRPRYNKPTSKNSPTARPHSEVFRYTCFVNDFSQTPDTKNHLSQQYDTPPVGQTAPVAAVYYAAGQHQVETLAVLT